jgi:hypothetical protein
MKMSLTQKWENRIRTEWVATNQPEHSLVSEGFFGGGGGSDGFLIFCF